MAGIKEQVRQLDDLNKDSIEEQTRYALISCSFVRLSFFFAHCYRFLSRMTNVAHLGPSPNLAPTNGPGMDEEEEEL